MMHCYFDNAATSRVREEVIQAMIPCFDVCYGNPSGVYGTARKASSVVYQARDMVAAAIGCSSNEIVFTSGGTESDTMAIEGFVNSSGLERPHVITTAIEHEAVLKTIGRLTRNGRITSSVVSPEPDGIVSPEKIKNAICTDTALVSVMYANNEVGTIQPIETIGSICREKGICFHTDAVQAVGHIPIDVKRSNIDMLSISGHKFHGPKGSGALYIRKGIRCEPVFVGGEQERSRRAGTENVPGIIGMATALSLACDEMPNETIRLKELRDKTIEEIVRIMPGAILNGSACKRLPGNINIHIPGIKGESLLLMLDKAGVEVSLGSACAAGSPDPSHVLLAMGFDEARAKSSIRITFSKYTTREEVNYFLETMKSIAAKMPAQQHASLDTCHSFI